MSDTALRAREPSNNSASGNGTDIESFRADKELSVFKDSEIEYPEGGLRAWSIVFGVSFLPTQAKGVVERYLCSQRCWLSLRKGFLSSLE